MNSKLLQEVFSGLNFFKVKKLSTEFPSSIIYLTITRNWSLWNISGIGSIITEKILRKKTLLSAFSFTNLTIRRLTSYVAGDKYEIDSFPELSNHAIWSAKKESYSAIPNTSRNIHFLLNKTALPLQEIADPLKIDF